MLGFEIYIACTLSIQSSCLNLAKSISIAEPASEIHIGLSSKEEFPKEFWDRLDSIQNTIVTSVDIRPKFIPLFLRDTGILGKDSFLALPYKTVFKPKVLWNAFLNIEVSTFTKADIEFVPSWDGLFGPILEAQYYGENDGLYGGNFLKLDSSNYLVGKSLLGNGYPKFRSVMDSYGYNFETVSIPYLAVGHVDEVFNPIKISGDSCHYQVLRASPQLAVSFLRKFKRKQIRIPKMDKDESTSIQQVSIREFLEDSHTVEKRTARIEQIKNGSLELEQAIKNIDNKCTIEWIDLPMIWSRNGLPIWSNPVNGLKLNKYFHSKSQLIGEEHTTKIELRLQQKVEKIFRKKLSVPAIPVDTKEYDSRFGNIHCATQERVIEAISE